MYSLLGKSSYGDKVLKDQGRKLIDFLQYSDGTNDLDKISKIIKLDLNKAKSLYNLLKKNNLILKSS